LFDYLKLDPSQPLHAHFARIRVKGKLIHSAGIKILLNGQAATDGL